MAICTFSMILRNLIILLKNYYTGWFNELNHFGTIKRIPLIIRKRGHQFQVNLLYEISRNSKMLVVFVSKV